MKTLIPKVKRMRYSQDVLIERSLPIKGDINVKVGDSVDPVTRIGMTKISTGISYLPGKLKFAKGKFESGYFYFGEKVGRVGSKKVVAPFDGYISTNQSGHILTQEPKEHWLLSGVWGTVHKRSESGSVLIKTQTNDIYLSVCSNKFINGEFVVFPNPTDDLQIQYLQNFAKDVFSKIIYLGNFATFESVEKSVQLGVAGILAGSADKQTFDYAKENGLNMGLISGFGRLETPSFIYDFIKEVSNRFVFMVGEKNLLRIPLPKDSAQADTDDNQVLVEPQQGMRVQVFQKPYFCQIGEITGVQDSSLYVKLAGAEQPVQIFLPNVLAL